MTTIVDCLKVNAAELPKALRDIASRLDEVDPELVLDFTPVSHIEPATLGALNELAAIADSKGIKIILGGVNVDIYRVLKLSRVAQRFSFVA